MGIVHKISTMYNMLNLVKRKCEDILENWWKRVNFAVSINNNTFVTGILVQHMTIPPQVLSSSSFWYLSQYVVSWMSPSWKGLGQRWPWSQVWLSNWWTGSPAAACGRTGVSVAGPESSQVEGVDLVVVVGQTQQFTSLIHKLWLLGLTQTPYCPSATFERAC